MSGAAALALAGGREAVAVATERNSVPPIGLVGAQRLLTFRISAQFSLGTLQPLQPLATPCEDAGQRGLTVSQPVCERTRPEQARWRAADSGVRCAPHGA